MILISSYRVKKADRVGSLIKTFSKWNTHLLLSTTDLKLSSSSCVWISCAVEAPRQPPPPSATCKINDTNFINSIFASTHLCHVCLNTHIHQTLTRAEMGKAHRKHSGTHVHKHTQTYTHIHTYTCVKAAQQVLINSVVSDVAFSSAVATTHLLLQAE